MNVNDGAKRILCFGDSNTWGLTPMSNDLRYAPSLRWTGRLQLILGKEFEIIEEGLNSRYIDKSDSREGKEGKNAEEYILPCIDSHDPLDKIVIMLGTNDMRARYSAGINEIGISMERLVEKVIHRMAERKISDLILVSPPYINEDTEYASKLFAGAADKSRKIGKVYSDIAQKYGIIFVDTGPIALVGKDGIHMTHEGHVALADELYRILR